MNFNTFIDKLQSFIQVLRIIQIWKCIVWQGLQKISCDILHLVLKGYRHENSFLDDLMWKDLQNNFFTTIKTGNQLWMHQYYPHWQSCKMKDCGVVKDWYRVLGKRITRQGNQGIYFVHLHNWTVIELNNDWYKE